MVETGEGQKRNVAGICSYRWALAFIGFFGFLNIYALRVNMSVAMVCMLNQTGISLYQKSLGEDNVTSVVARSIDDYHCFANGTGPTNMADGEFIWPKKTQGLILSSFFWGYLITQIPGGWLAQRIGGKRVIAYFSVISIISTLLSSLGARFSPYLLIALRILNGIGQGAIFPAMHVLWTKWAPPLERSKLIGFTYAGAQIGNVLALPLSAILCEYGFDGGWSSIFYVFGLIGVVWFALWMLIVSDTPAQHPRISEEEKNYIESSLGSNTSHPQTTPWLTFAKSLPVWAIVVAHVCANWGTYTLLTNIPTYMKEILKFDIKSNGLLCAVPYIIFWACINIGGFVADFLRSKGWRTETVRKIMLSTGTLVPGVLLIITGYITCGMPYAAVAVLSLSVGFSGFQYPGVMVNHVDIAPPFAGVLFGISNTVATLSGVFAPYVIGVITTNSTQAEWRIVFYLAAVIYLFGAVFFCIFAKGEIQPWVKPFMENMELEKNSSPPVVTNENHYHNIQDVTL